MRILFLVEYFTKLLNVKMKSAVVVWCAEQNCVLKQISATKQRNIFTNWKNFWFSTITISTVVRFWQVFRRKFRRKKSSYSIPSYVTLNNLIEADKRKRLRGEISLVHCRGHDCIMLLFYFDGFHDNHRRLLSKNFISDEKNGLPFLMEWTEN